MPMRLIKGGMRFNLRNSAAFTADILMGEGREVKAGEVESLSPRAVDEVAIIRKAGSN